MNLLDNKVAEIEGHGVVEISPDDYMVIFNNDLEDITMGDYHPSSNRTQSMELVEKYGMYISNNRDINQPLTEWYASCYPHCESRNESDTHAEVIQMGSTLMEAVCNAVIANFERIEYEKN
jgi:hypothetical protein